MSVNSKKIVLCWFYDSLIWAIEWLPLVSRWEGSSKKEGRERRGVEMMIIATNPIPRQPKSNRPIQSPNPQSPNPIWTPAQFEQTSSATNNQSSYQTSQDNNSNIFIPINSLPIQRDVHLNNSPRQRRPLNQPPRTTKQINTKTKEPKEGEKDTPPQKQKKQKPKKL